MSCCRRIHNPPSGGPTNPMVVQTLKMEQSWPEVSKVTLKIRKVGRELVGVRCLYGTESYRQGLQNNRETPATLALGRAATLHRV